MTYQTINPIFTLEAITMYAQATSNSFLIVIVGKNSSTLGRIHHLVLHIINLITCGLLFHITYHIISLSLSPIATTTSSSCQKKNHNQFFLNLSTLLLKGI